MDAVLLSIGTELTSGQTLDTNAAWLARQLAALGATVLKEVVVPDARDAVGTEVRQACETADLVLITGGLGPTDDDLTRHALADVLGVDLAPDPVSLERIAAFFRTRCQSMPEANRVQAMFPIGSEPIPNAWGTAPGIRARCRRAVIVALPGVPREMQAMFTVHVRPALVAQAGGATRLTATLHCFGAGESEIGERIRDLMAPGRNPLVGTTANQGIIALHVRAHGPTIEATRTLLENTVHEVRDRLGSLVFGRDDQTLAGVVGEQLRAARGTLATAESCTGGLIAALLTDVPGSSDYYREGVVTYANEAKTRLLGVSAELLAQYGAVSPQVAEAMAAGCRARARTDYALSTTGIAGPAGGSDAKPVGLVYIALADADGCRVTEHRFGNFLDRDDIRRRAAYAALNRLRLHLAETGSST